MDSYSMKAKYKYEVAAAAGVSIQTFRSWIRERVESDDAAFIGYNKNSKLLTPAQIESLSRKYCIIF